MNYSITINSAFEGGRAREFVFSTPVAGRMADDLGTRYPNAQQIANYYAAEFCDSGTVSVIGRRGRDRGLVARATLPA